MNKFPTAAIMLSIEQAEVLTTMLLDATEGTQAKSMALFVNPNQEELLIEEVSNIIPDMIYSGMVSLILMEKDVEETLKGIREKGQSENLLTEVLQ